MRKKCGCLIPVFMLLFALSMAVLMTEAYAVPAYYQPVVKTRKIEVKQKGYLRVISSYGVNHTLYFKKPDNMKNYRTQYGSEVYFAVTPGTYYLKSSSSYDFAMACTKKRAPADYRKNTTMESAENLEPGKMKVALSYAKDKEKENIRYYKLTPQRDSRIIFTGGVLCDSDGNAVSGITSSIYPKIYTNDGAKNPKKVTWYEGFPGVFPYLRSSTLEPLKAGQTYYLKVDLKQTQPGPVWDRKKGKSVNGAVPVSWRYDEPMAVIFSDQ